MNLLLALPATVSLAATMLATMGLAALMDEVRALDSEDLLAVLATVGLAATLTRFLRQSALTAGLRRRLSARSPLLEKLFSCPHCLCFWTALAGAALLAHTWLVFAASALLGWRGAYNLNRLLDYLGAKTRSRQPQAHGSRDCHQCGTPWNRAFLERQGHFFCSYRCWFNYLKELRQGTRRAETSLFDAGGVFIHKDIYFGGYQEIGPGQAQQLLGSGAGYVYLDVRSPLEFANGHPAGAVNLPLFYRQAGEWAPNRDFLRVAEVHFSRPTRLLVGCQFGARSSLAVEALLSAGFTAVTHVRGGFQGARDLIGRTVAPGWFELGLPVEYGDPDGQSYASLLAGAKMPVAGAKMPVAGAKETKD